jgi:pimeloyl-ACP methyl ester carboxylesterase
MADVNGTQLYYEMAGAGLPVVFVHGFTLDTRMWDAQFDVFAERYQAIRYDVRGFGRSPVGDVTSYSALDDLQALLDHLGIESAALVGLSMGGGIVTSFALAHPKRTRALITVDSNLWGHVWSEGWGASFAPQRGILRESGVAGVKQFWLAHPLFGPASEKPAVRQQLKQIVDDYSGWHWQNRDPERGLDPPTAQRLAEIQAPTLVVVGERDLPDFQSIADRLAREISNARKVVLPGVGHMANMEDPSGFNEAALEFLAGLD